MGTHPFLANKMAILEYVKITKREWGKSEKSDAEVENNLKRELSQYYKALDGFGTINITFIIIMALTP